MMGEHGATMGTARDLRARVILALISCSTTKATPGRAAALAEGEVIGLREALAREEARASAATQQASAQVAAEAKRREEVQAGRYALQAELSAWTAGGPLARARRGF